MEGHDETKGIGEFFVVMTVLGIMVGVVVLTTAYDWLVNEMKGSNQ